ncbi:MAG: translesion error-prone DNA polymerase V autoproteolytic subunit [Bacteroidetes bacterium]|jgi:DNA polymerase V|nr:translesion error-prone DNA polymerase V autoproteolytic subunit [Bacteroidota bacterium]
MNEKLLYRTAYTGTKSFTQQDVKTANATGFGAAADDFMERGIDLNEELINNKAATYFFRMNSDAMEQVGIFKGDVLVVDRSLKLLNGKVIVAAVNGELIVRRFEKELNKATLSATNKKFKDIVLDEFTEFNCWGMITYVIHRVN